METKKENTVQEHVTTNLSQKRIHSFQNMMSLKVSLHYLRYLVNQGTLTEDDYKNARIIIVEKYGLNSNTIYA